MIQQDVTQEALKASPAIAVGSLSIMGYGISDWTMVLTIIYVAFQLFFLIRDKWWRDRGGKRGNKG
jgi:hypothetical protein